VTLFGGLTYAVQLTENYTEPSSQQFSIFYDAATRKRFDPILLADEMSLIRIALSKETIFENRKLVDAQWSPLIEVYYADTRHKCYSLLNRMPTMF